MSFAPLTEEELEKMTVDEFKERAQGRGPFSWENYAELLKKAADIILKVYTPVYEKIRDRPNPYYAMDVEYGPEDDLHLVEIYYLLIGLSIENLIKGIIMTKHPEYNLEKIKTHKTLELLRENHISGFEKFKTILDELSNQVIWKSKYPVPIPLDPEIISYNLNLVKPNDANELYEKLHKKLKQEKMLRDLRDKHNVDLSIEEFSKIKKEIIEFMKPDTQIEEILDAYCQYPYPLIKDVLKEHIDDLQKEDQKDEIKVKIWIYEEKTLSP